MPNKLVLAAAIVAALALAALGAGWKWGGSGHTRMAGWAWGEESSLVDATKPAPPATPSPAPAAVANAADAAVVIQP